jgi:glycosyltransferase involved in cell wall biosynthesis
MRILQVNKFHYLRGGAEKYFLDMSAQLAAHGHEVAVFSMRHPKNLPSPWEKYFVSRLSFNEPKLRDKLLAPGRIIWSLEAQRKFARLVKDFRPDVIHIHNIYHQLSPSILAVAKKHKISVVMHLHDYKLVCPNYKLYTHGEICERCLKQRYFQAVCHNCFRDSFLMSSLVMKEMYLHHSILKIYEKSVSCFIAPSQFMKETVVKFGHSRDKVEVLYNFVDQDGITTSVKTKDYLLYFGRLSEEKGLPVLLEALSKTKHKYQLKLAGEGPDLISLQKKVKDLKLESQVEFLGFQSGAVLKETIQVAKAIMMPSVWLENMPFALLEAVAAGKVVVASRTGGLPEVITDGQTGFLFETGSSADLTRVLDDLDNYDLGAMGQAAQKAAERFNFNDHFNKLLKIYSDLCLKKLP